MARTISVSTDGVMTIVTMAVGMSSEWPLNFIANVKRHATEPRMTSGIAMIAAATLSGPSKWNELVAALPERDGWIVG